MTEEIFPSEEEGEFNEQAEAETEASPVSGKLNPGKKLEPIGLSDDTAACEKNFN